MMQQLQMRAARLRLPGTAGSGIGPGVIVPRYVVLVGCLLAAGCGSAAAAAPGSVGHPPASHASSSAASGTGVSSASASGGTAPVHAVGELGSLRKILVIMEENHSYQQVFPAGMPYLWSLARQYGYATDWSDVGHPSLPNYLAIFGGSAFNKPDDCAPGPGCIYPGPTVFGQALTLGHTAKAYEESMPQPCDLGFSGEYDVNHNPWAYFPSEAASCRSNDVPAGTPTAGGLVSDVRRGNLPTVGLVTPNLLHDGHDGTLAQADAWLRAWIPVLMSGPDWRDGRLAIVVVFDEGETTEQVPFVLMAPGLSGVTMTRPANQYALTRLIDQFIGADPLRQASSAVNVAAQFGLS
jgi:phosphatidylinositol-3-phosphatase